MEDWINSLIIDNNKYNIEKIDFRYLEVSSVYKNKKLYEWSQQIYDDYMKHGRLNLPSALLVEIENTFNPNAAPSFGRQGSTLGGLLRHLGRSGGLSMKKKTTSTPIDESTLAAHVNLQNSDPIVMCCVFFFVVCVCVCIFMSGDVCQFVCCLNQIHLLV